MKIWAFQEQIKWRNTGWRWFTNEVFMRREDAWIASRKMFASSRILTPPPAKNRFRVIAMTVTEVTP